MKFSPLSSFKFKSIVSAVGILAIIVLACTTYFRIGYITIKYPDGSQKIAPLPIKENPGKIGKYHYSGTFKHTFLSPTTVHIVPDDCVLKFSINGKPVSLKHITDKALCDYRRGFDIDISQQVKRGVNTFQIQIENKKGNAGFSMERSWRSPTSILFIVFSLLFGTILFYSVLKKLALPRTVIGLLIMGALFHLCYISYTDYTERGNDVSGHIEHIKWIATHHTIPRSRDCEQCYHPPLYYVPLAMLYKLFSYAGLNDHQIFRLFQFFTFLWTQVFLIFGVFIFKETLRSKVQFHMATLLLCAWPITATYAARIGNDALVYPLFAAALYFMIRWYRTEKGRYFNLSLMLGILSFLTKTNGLLATVMLLALFAVKVFQKKQERFSYIKSKAVQFAILALFILSVFIVPKFYNYMHGDQSDWIVSNRSEKHFTQKRSRFLGNTGRTYAWFDVKTFVNEPYVSTTKDKGGRQWFWNHILKTSLFRSSSKSEYHKNIAQIVSFLFLIIMGTSLVYFLFLKRDEIFEHLPLILNALILLAAAMFMRYKVPESSMQEFRYIAWFLFSLIFFYVKSLDVFENRKLVVLQAMWYGVPILFSALSVSYFLIEP
ncbi:MAG: glycosyltransferase family 39 protein [Deltaproteobacteria bacterium]|nr:glycosyltransferase family 39 protein [Deltaproteobacteria bacterium]